VYEKFINVIVGGVGSSLSYFYGGWNASLEFLSLLVLADFVSGLIASIVEAGLDVQGGLSSRKGFKGLSKKGLMFLIIIIAHRADIVLEKDFLMFGAIWFYISNELISITENYGRIGFPLPPQVKQIIAILKSKEASTMKNGKENENGQNRLE